MNISCSQYNSPLDNYAVHALFFHVKMVGRPFWVRPVGQAYSNRVTRLDKATFWLWDRSAGRIQIESPGRTKSRHFVPFPSFTRKNRQAVTRAE